MFALMPLECRPSLVPGLGGPSWSPWPAYGVRDAGPGAAVAGVEPHHAHRFVSAAPRSPEQLSAYGDWMAERLELDMAELAFSKIPGVVVDARETQRAGPSYTVNTLQELRQENP